MTNRKGWIHLPVSNQKKSVKSTPLKPSRTKEVFSVPKEKTEFICFNCPRTFPKQTGNFPASQSNLYKYNNSFLPICNHCVDDLFEHYREALGNDEDAIRRICSKYDIYFSKSCFEASRKISATQSRIKGYISKTNLSQYQGKTYDDTLDEEQNDTVISIEDIRENRNLKVTQKTIKFWGLGYTPEEYKILDDEYATWVVRENNGQQPDKKLESCLKQACQALIDIQRARVSGNSKDVAAFNKVYIDALQAAGLKPIQADNTSAAEKNSLGVLIEKWEQTEPVPDIAPEFKDVDKIKHYVDVFFKGHLCRMFGMQNDTTDIYNEEILKYKVSPPKLEDGD